MKELRFHPQYSCLVATTAEDSFNVFRPNLEPVDSREDNNSSDDEAMAESGNVAMSSENTKQDTSANIEESKQ